MKKAVAVPYVIALILGVAVIGLVGYWFATSGGKFGGQSSKTICDNKFLQYCITNPTSNYDNFDNTNTECTGLGSYTQCSELVGVGGGGGPGSGGSGSVALLGDCSSKSCQSGLTCCNAASGCTTKDNTCKKSSGSCTANSQCVDNRCNAPQAGGQSVC